MNKVAAKIDGHWRYVHIAEMLPEEMNDFFAKASKNALILKIQTLCSELNSLKKECNR